MSDLLAATGWIGEHPMTVVNQGGRHQASSAAVDRPIMALARADARP